VPALSAAEGAGVDGRLLSYVIPSDSEESGEASVVKECFGYILTNRSGILYAGITNNLVRRVAQHQSKEIDGFTKRYNVTQLVYYESTNDVRVALEREKQVKAWTRAKRVALIESMNPSWKDLAEEWLHPAPPDSSRSSSLTEPGTA